ncbi:uroporphyrinogen-III synthase [Salinimonas sediminis]|uniref:Uroporphyrinogen-III synthase n=1 Tax=Salinimonas sediminis TaxID=2303538 RepID=A0A346NRN9_9ALTE|nr:uroporphyrinogen-III synthase [Salinimonas sediminis]AXR08196.1 uroporphyrinogen-III synthase [Salinimonas sediminis]
MYLLTRPAPALARSEQAFAAHQLNVSVLGLVDITYHRAPVDALHQQLTAGQVDILVVTSQYAVKACTPAIRLLPWKVTVLAVGQGTGRALQQLGLNAIVPAQATSEGLLALTQLKDAKNKQIVIIKGVAGRTTLADALNRAGAHVTSLAVYERTIPNVYQQTNYWQWSDVKGIIATSEEMARQLFARLNNSKLTEQRWLTVSARVADVIRAFGVTDVEVATGASDDELAQWIKDNWE